MRIVGYLLSLVLVVMAMGSSAPIFIDIPSLLLLAGFTIWGLLGAAGCQTGAVLKAACRPDRAEASILITSQQALRSTRSTVMAGGCFAAVAGLVIMLKNLDDPSQIGPGMAIGVLGWSYALLLAYVVLLPLQAGVERQLLAVQGEQPVQTESRFDMMVLIGGLAFAALNFVVLIFAFTAKG